jgi:hypothetical protein
VGVGQLGGHVEFELHAVRDVLVAQSKDPLGAFLYHLLVEDGL